MAGVLRLYFEATLDTLVSTEGSFGAPDSVASLDGGDGDTDETAFWVAAEQGVLNSDMDDSQTDLTLLAARFATLPLIAVVTGAAVEVMAITAGGGTTGLTVTRAQAGTSAIAHTTGDRVYLAYDTTSNSISCRDNEQVVSGDESTWIEYAEDDGGAGTYAASLSLGNLAYDSSQKIWRKVTIPASTSPKRKTDLIHDISHDVSEATL
ncbi:MAG: hypothetical protein WC455_14575 [Dehalococcoidia bacterium]|jgi:hypothetical protein